MFNGEGIQENISDVASPDPYGDDASSHLSEYSSCGDSEFERYCSANSVMGTASLCSSLGNCNEFLDSDLGSIRSLGFGEDRVLEIFGSLSKLDRSPGNHGTASLISSDCLPDGRIELDKEISNVHEGVFEEEEELQGSLMVTSRSKSLPSNDENSSTILEFGNGSNLIMNVDLDASSYRFNEFDREGSMSLRGCSKSVSDLETSSNRFDHHSKSGWSPNIQETDNAEHSEENLLMFKTQNGSHFLMGSKEESPYSSSTAVCEEGLTEQVHGDPSLFHGLTLNSGFPIDDEMRTGGSPDADEQTSSRYEHSDDEGSMFGSGIDDEEMVDLYSKRNLKYNQETHIGNRNPLLINSSAAFGLDDWDDFVQETEKSTLNNWDDFVKETEKNTLASVLLDKLQGQQKQHLSEERNTKNSTSVTPSISPFFGESEQEENGMDIPVASHQTQCTNGYANLKSCSVIAAEKDKHTQKASAVIGLNIMDGVHAAKRELRCNEEFIGPGESDVPENELLWKSGLQLDPLSYITNVQCCSSTTEPSQDNEETRLEGEKQIDPLMFKDSPRPKNICKNHLASIEIENLELNESYDEVVHEMEEILLDTGESPSVGFSKGNKLSPFQLPLPFRDGSSTASTSDSNDAYLSKIDEVEVVGAKQKKGDVSLGERLVGVKEHTIYKLRVWSGKNQWEVEHRYRDFFSLYRHLKTLFADQGWILPPPWSCVERESRKIFGSASPNVITERSILIQECLRSILHAGFPSSTPSSLIQFLSPQESDSSFSSLNTRVPESTSLLSKESCMEDGSALGKTISLVVEIQPSKSMKQLLEAQHYTCAGCHRHFDGEKTRMLEFVRTFGWGKPRLCEYTGQLFCTSCHTNETAVLPARVLNLWEFTHFPVSQMAKSYLESIHDQPMLCVSAVNPVLFSKVPALLHVMGMRKKIGSMLPHVRCPFRGSIHKGLGSRRYLLENNDFFALRDLIDLSKGAFAALPVMVETVSKKILEHITEQCLVCCDAGVPCGAQQACEDTSSLIFPFQESEVERCSSCDSVLHKDCLRKLASCPCGAHFVVDKEAGPVDGSLGKKPDSRLPTRFLASLFSKTRQEEIGSPRNSTVILMGSLPSTSI